MKTITKIGVALLLIVALGLTVVVWSYYETRIAQSSPEPNCSVEGGPCEYSFHGLNFRTLFPTMRTVLVRIMIENKVPASKLDFSLPGTAGYGDNPALEVFSPDNGHNLLRVNLSSVSSKPEVIYTFGNRMGETGEDSELEMAKEDDGSELIAIIPDVFEEVCKDVNEGASIPEIPKISLLPFPEEPQPEQIIDLPSSEFSDYWGCLKSEGRYYYYHLLVER